MPRRLAATVFLVALRHYALFRCSLSAIIYCSLFHFRLFRFDYTFIYYASAFLRC